MEGPTDSTQRHRGGTGPDSPAGAPQDEPLIRAFELAYFIYPDAPSALGIATAALAKLDVACVAQDKRLYYVPVGRGDSTRSRTKVRLDDLQLLQRLVYVEADPYEQQEERSARVPAEESMIVRFVKHLVRIVTRRNSFYVTLGITRILHTYSTAETMAIYDVIVQDPDRTRDDYYYRSRKQRLIAELKLRFGDRITIQRSARGEERIEAHEHADNYVALVRECLARFTPWSTTCVLPVRFEPRRDVITPLRFAGGDPDREHATELHRFHTLLHPPCYDRTTAALGLDTPEARLAVPRFRLHDRSDDHMTKRDRRHPPALSEEDFLRAQGYLSDLAKQRKHAAAAWLRIKVDGTERARLDVARLSRVRVDLEEGDELLEVVADTDRGELLMVTRVLGGAPVDRAGPLTSSITLEGGQKFTFTIAPREGSSPVVDAGGLSIEVSYRETRLLRVAAAYWRGVRDGIRSPAWQGWMAPAVVAASAILVVGSVVLLNYPGGPPLIAPTAPQAPVESSGQPAVPPPQPSAPSRGSPSPLPAPKTGRAGASPNVARDPQATRSVAGVPASVPLRDVRRIYVDAFGGDAAAERLRQALMAALDASDRFTAAKEIDDGQAAFKGSVRITAPDEVIVEVRLVDVNGATLWPRPAATVSYRGSVEIVATRIVSDLHAFIEK